MPASTLVIRAVPTALVRASPYTVVVGVLTLILVTMRAAFGGGRYDNPGIGWWALPAVGALLGLPLIVAGALLWARRRNLRIELDESTMTVRDPYGRSSSWPRADVKTLWHVPVRTNLENGYAVLLLGEKRRILGSLWHKSWDLERLAPLAAALGVNIEGSALSREQNGLTVEEARRRYPGIVIPAQFVHPLILGLLGGLAVLAYAASWVAVMVWLTL